MSARRAAAVRKFGLGILLAASCTAGGAGEQPRAVGTSAIVSGSTDTQDPAVVGIGVRRVDCDARLAVHCTGMLIAPRLVLTAAHCTEAPLGSNLEVLFGSDVTDPAAVISRVTEVQVHPEYPTVGGAADLALLVLADYAPAAPVALNATALDDTWLGRSVRLVGFGQTQPSGEPPETKRTGTATISALQSAELRIVPGPSLSCHGDSGGPLFATINGRELVVGVTTTGDPGCATYGRNVRVDAFLNDFILPGIARAATSDPIPATDGPLATAPLCTADCAHDADCPAGLRCQLGPTTQGLAARCVIPGLLAGALSSACTSATQCTQRCVRLRAAQTPQACRCYEACATETPPPAEDSGCNLGRSPATHPERLIFLVALLFFSGWCRRKRNTACLP